jgi:hypothetical protein
MRSVRSFLAIAMILTAGFIFGCGTSETGMKNFKEMPNVDPDAKYSPPNKSGAIKEMPEGVPGGVAPPLPKKVGG